MTANTTAAAGYLTPTSPPVEREVLEDALQALVVGVTGLPGKNVRPRFQPKPPRRPAADESWCAIGVSDTLGRRSGVVHDGSGDGSAEVVNVEILEALATFYGPAAAAMAARLRDGLALAQNRAELRRAGIVVAEIGTPRPAPELVAGAWAQRVDLPLNVQWETRQAYGVLNLLDAPGTVETDDGVSANIMPLA